VKHRSLRAFSIWSAAVAFALAVPLIAYAFHDFTDVPTSAFYHDPVSALAAAGITAGCGGTNFCPEASVTRGQTATFLHRSLGRVGMSTRALRQMLQTETQPVVSLTFTVPGTGASVMQFVEVRGQVSLLGGCAGCGIGTWVRERAGLSGPIAYSLGDPTQVSLGASYVFVAGPGVHTYEMVVSISGTDTVGVANPVLIATTYAFGEETVGAALNGANEVGGGDPDGAGSAVVHLDHAAGQICYELTVTNISSATGAHIHSGSAGVNGPIVVNFTPPDGSGSSSGCVGVDRGLIKDILVNPSGYYVNIHSTEYLGGAMRGQLSP
jgi:CHRD domain/S-layer homology domain